MRRPRENIEVTDMDVEKEDEHVTAGNFFLIKIILSL